MRPVRRPSRTIERLDTPGGRLDLSGRTLVAGVLNVTPDSFSDGGQFDAPAAAIEQARRMVAEGADLLDVGAESTRPGSERVSAAEQIARLKPVLKTVVGLGVPVSVDTTRSDVAAVALEAGAAVLNDVSAGRDDPEMFALAARAGVPIVLMHMLGEPKTMQREPRYDDVVAEVAAFLDQRAAAAVAAGVGADRIVVDPGIGFGKTTRHNLELIGRIDALLTAGRPVMVGPSRKRFIGHVLGIDEPAQRVVGTGAVVAACALAGVQIVRVHDVAPAAQTVRMCHAIHRPALVEPRT